MKTEHLKQLFGKSAIFQSDDLQTYIISLLSKFELALRWDEENLLLPSLLPSEDERGLQEAVKVVKSMLSYVYMYVHQYSQCSIMSHCLYICSIIIISVSIELL